MKKTISLLLTLVLCLSLCACGSKAEAETSENRTEGQTVQNTPQNTEEVNTQPSETQPIETEPKPAGKHTVEITMDNVDTYFEEYTFDIWELNAFNELSHFENRSLYVLKEEYAQGLVEKETDIAIETKIVSAKYHVTADLENRTWERNALDSSSSTDYTRVQNCRTISYCKERNAYGIELGCPAFLNGVTQEDNSCQHSFEILRVTGTLVYMG